MKCIISWVVFSVAVYGCYVAVHAFKNPFSTVGMLPVPSVVKLLPPASHGCGKECNYD